MCIPKHTNTWCCRWLSTRGQWSSWKSWSPAWISQTATIRASVNRAPTEDGAFRTTIGTGAIVRWTILTQTANIVSGCWIWNSMLFDLRWRRWSPSNIQSSDSLQSYTLNQCSFVADDAAFCSGIWSYLLLLSLSRDLLFADSYNECHKYPVLIIISSSSSFILKTSISSMLS